jgi:hypothetical protein
MKFVDILIQSTKRNLLKTGLTNQGFINVRELGKGVFILHINMEHRDFLEVVKNQNNKLLKIISCYDNEHAGELETKLFHNL